MVRSVVREQIEKALEDHRFKDRSIIAHSKAPRYFDGRVGEERIREYIRGKDLPEGTDLPLPAEKKGRLYFIEVEKLLRWQAGETEVEELSEWQRRRGGLC